jgi:hypothetical protein
MPGLVPGIHVFLADLEGSKAWMAGTSPAMTECVDLNVVISYDFSSARRSV